MGRDGAGIVAGDADQSRLRAALSPLRLQRDIGHRGARFRRLVRRARSRSLCRATHCLGRADVARADLGALVNIKQDSIALVAGLLGAALVLALLQGREGRGRALAALLLAAAPALLLYAAWR